MALNSESCGEPLSHVVNRPVPRWTKPLGKERADCQAAGSLLRSISRCDLAKRRVCSCRWRPKPPHLRRFAWSYCAPSVLLNLRAFQAVRGPRPDIGSKWSRRWMSSASGKILPASGKILPASGKILPASGKNLAGKWQESCRQVARVVGRRSPSRRNAAGVLRGQSKQTRCLIRCHGSIATRVEESF